MKKNLFILLWIFMQTALVRAQLNLNITDTTVCKNTPFLVCANIPAVNLSGLSFDDKFSGVINIGFPFVFYGQTVTQCIIAENNFITFDLGLANLSSEYTYNNSSNAGELSRSIMFPYQDVDVSFGGVIRYMTVGQVPNRKFVVEFCDVAYYSTPCHSLRTRNQLVLYEGTNEIEMHLGQVAYCSGWPLGSANGHAVQGIRSGSNQMFATGREPGSTPWTVNNNAPQGHKFVPSGAGTYTISSIGYNPVPFILQNQGAYSWFAENATTPFATTVCATITPDTAIDYYVVKYVGPVGCGAVTASTLLDTVNVNYQPIDAIKPLTYCANQLPATWNGITIPAGASSNANYDTLLVNGAGNACDTSFIINLTVTPAVIPAFTQVAPICSGGNLSALPTSSNNGITGSWSPAINNTATTTYTFTPAAGQCANTATMTITVNPPTNPLFSQVAPICTGGTLNPLPLTSNNGISGTWAPALNNLATTTYTFTPAAGQCANPATMTITVNPIVTPAFTQVAPICVGGTLNPLPLNSNNGISGTWSPAPNNAQTTTYTFTPAAGQCAITTTMTINVLPNVVPAFNAVAPICAGGTLNPLPLSSTNGVGGTWSPALNNMATTTYTFTPNAGQCASVVQLTIQVIPNVTPVFTPIAPICPGRALSPLPLTSNNGVTGTWSPALNNTATTTYTFTPNGGQTCVLPGTLQIIVLPYLTGQRNIEICEGSNYTFNGVVYTTSVSGVKDTIANTTVCDSIITLNLTVRPKTYGTQTAVICEGASYTFNGQQYVTTNTTAKDTLINQWGCDSIVTLNLTMMPVNPLAATDTLQGCGRVVYNSRQYTANTQFVDTLRTIFGCDSIYKTVQIFVFPEYHDTLNVNVLGCDSALYQQKVYHASTRLIEEYKTSHGCDSLVKVINIEVHNFNLYTEVDPERPYAGETFTIEALAANNVAFDVLSWTPAALFPDQQAKIQRIALNEPQVIVVTASSKGCVDTAIVNVGDLPTYSTDVQMPNAFSPNGDGLNDVFKPVFKIDRAYTIEHFTVYNRYGQFVYTTSNINSGWDGYYKGRLQDQGVYYYIVKIRFMDDSERTIKGDVTLIK